MSQYSLEEWLAIMTISDGAGGRKLKTTTSGGLDDVNSILTKSDSLGGRMVKVDSSGGGGTSITVVANYAALPNPTTVSGQFYWCEASQGTWWLPFSYGGTYYSAGMYYSNGTIWTFMETPFQSTQIQVDAGINDDTFVTPLTLNNYSRWATKLPVAAAANYRLTASDGSGNRGNVAAITAARALKSDANGVPTHFDTATEPSLTELSYVKGVTSAIQTQLDALANTQTLTCFGLVLTTVADSSNYHIGTIAGAPSSSDARRAFRFTKAGTVTDAAFTLEQVTNGSNDTVNIYLRNVTTATDTAIGTFTSDFGASTTLKALFTGLGISVNTADDYTIRISTPAFGTNPTSWIPSLTLQITV